MKRLLTLTMLSLSISGYTCVDLQGEFQQRNCDNNKPSTVLQIPFLENINFTDDNVLEISQDNCSYDFVLNGTPIGNINEGDHSNWQKSYPQARDERKASINNRNMNIRSRRVNPMPLVNNNRVNITIKLENDELVINRKETDTWHMGRPVIDRWESTCYYDKI